MRQCSPLKSEHPIKHGLLKFAYRDLLGLSFLNLFLSFGSVSVLHPGFFFQLPKDGDRNKYEQQLNHIRKCILHGNLVAIKIK